MSKRLLKIADMLFPAPGPEKPVTPHAIQVMRDFADGKPMEKAPGGDHLFSKEELDQRYPEASKDADLQAEDLANRLDAAVEAVGDCISILKELGMDSGRAESEILSIVKDEISPEAVPGGLASGKPDSDFDPAQIEKGIKVELEHTGDAEKARDIAKDHLVEIPDYYDRLEKMEEGADKKEQSAADPNDEVAKNIHAARPKISRLWFDAIDIVRSFEKATKAANAANHPLRQELESLLPKLQEWLRTTEFTVLHAMEDSLYEYEHPLEDEDEE